MAVSYSNPGTGQVIQQVDLDHNLKKRRPRSLGSEARHHKLRQRRRLPSGGIGLFLASFTLFLASSYVVAFQFKFALGDAMSRTYSAFTAIYAAYPHLGTVGFIWPPLLTLLQMPLVLFKPLVYYGFAGMIVTSAFGAGTLVVLERLYRHLRFPFLHRLVLAVAFALNPFILYYSANGMSEIVFVFFFSAALCLFVVWGGSNEWRHVAVIGVAVACAFYVRYDAMALALAMFGAILLSMRTFGEGTPQRMEGVLLAYTTTVAYGVAVWIFLNWIIMRDPLYFYRSEYSNLYLTQMMRNAPDVVALRESVQATILYTIDKTARLSPAFVLFAALAALSGLFLRKRMLFLTLPISLAVPAFQVYMYRQGTTFGFDRFYISVIPATFILYAILAGMTGRHRAFIRVPLTGILLLALLGSTGATAYRMYQEGASSGEGIVMQAALNWQEVNNYALDEEVASYITSHSTGRSVLTDSAYADRIVLFTQDPRLFVHTSDPDFKEILQNPAGKIDYILALSPEFMGFNAVAEQYPYLWERGTSFTRLEKDFGMYRLYRVLPTDAAR